MNAVVASEAAVANARADACFHCGEPLPATPARLAFDGTTRLFCCDGCAAAAQWIDDADLDAYYRLRDKPGARVDADDAALALWDREEVQAAHARDVPGGREITLLTDGMRCAACAWLIDRALSREPGVLEVGANAVTGRIRVAWDPAATALSTPLRRLQALGYKPYLGAGAEQERQRRRERNQWVMRIGIAGLASMQAMMFAEALYLDIHQQMPVATRDFLRWITFLVSTPVVLYAGWPFIVGAVRELRLRAPGMDTLIAGSALLAWAGSVVETVRGGPEVWYDAAVMFVFLLLVARLLEQRVRTTANAQVDALARARPAFAVREAADGARETVAVGSLQVGDVVRVAPGEPVPADSLLLDTDASFAEALLTGEAHPVPKQPGAPVFAGSVCGAQAARLQLTAVGTQTRLSQLATLIEQAQAHRPPLAQLADRIARWFVLGLGIATVIVYLAWRAHDPSRALEVTLALLVVCCPCALSLAVPAALAAANGALAKLGVLPVSPDAMTRLAAVDTVVFDKTGTLATPSGALQVQAHGGLPADDALRIAAGAGARQRASAGRLLRAGRGCRRAGERGARTPGRRHRGRGRRPPLADRPRRLRRRQHRRRRDLAGRRHPTGCPLRPRRTAARGSRRHLAPARRPGHRRGSGQRRRRGGGTALRRRAGHRQGARADVAGGQAGPRPRPAGRRAQRGDGRRRHQRRPGAGRRRRVLRAGRRQRAGRARRRPGAGLAATAAHPAGDRAGAAHPRDHPAEPRLGAGLQRAGASRRRAGHGDAVAGRAGHGGVLADRHPQRAAAGAGARRMNALLLLIPLSLGLLVFILWAFAWAVRKGQFEDLDTPALDILDDDTPRTPPSAAAPVPNDDDAG